MTTTTWTWDTAANGIGRLHWVKSADAVKTYSYTKRGQPEGMTLSVGNESFAAKMTYDDMGRAKSLEYPWPLGEQPFGATYDYDAHGHRTGVRDTYTNTVYWQLTNVDQAGRYKAESFGNGVTTARSYFNEKGALKSITTTKGASTIQQLSYDWDEQLNLKSRTDALQPQHKTERFRHDALNRLTCAYFSPNENPVAPCISSYGYAPNGNLTSKSDVGILSYTDAKHPHAVTNAPGESYTYNAVGNQVTRPGGTTITYTPFDLPKTIAQGGTSISFGYDGNERRIRKTTSTTETVYFDDLFEQVNTGNTKAYRYYVHSPERVVAIVTRGGNEPGTTYVHVDHLGSTETLTNAKGEPAEKRSYDPFGQRRNENWALPPPASFTSKTTKGFTGHEEDNEFGLVNMRGRVFDPRLGRFLSTDPIIKSVFDGQALNAFAYVRNNPLALVDPSGFEPEKPPILPIAQRITHEPDGSITVDLLYPPREGQPQKTFQPIDEATWVCAAAPVTDTDPTGSGAQLPSKTLVEEASLSAAVWDGLGDAARGIWDDWTTPIWDTAFEMYDAYKKGDALDAFNVVNPLIGPANLGLAIEDDDEYEVTRQSVAIGVTVIVGIVVGKVVAGGTGGGKGGKTTRGPPKGAGTDHHVMTNKNHISAVRGGPWTPVFEEMAKKAGMTLEDVRNRVHVDGHRGPHPQAYHQEVFERLRDATKGKTGEGYSREFRKTLEQIRTEAATPGSRLNRMITKE